MTSRVRNHRGQPGRQRFVLLAMTCWLIVFLLVVAIMLSGSMAAENEGEQDLPAARYFTGVIPGVSRGGNDARTASKDQGEIGQSAADGENENSGGNNLLTGMLISAFPVLEATEKNHLIGTSADEDSSDPVETANTEENDILETDEKDENTSVSVVDTETGKNPVVFIYHTHATEAYRENKDNNYRALDEAGTVREVGNALTEELEARGIGVIHSQAIHDSPSYNKSYSRSLETVQTVLAQNPSIQMVIDLHRDAAAYSGGAGKTFQYNGVTAAQYSLVVGMGNANASKLMNFANRVNAKAEELYPGMLSKTIEKDYKYNQYVHDNHILLEVGNNENTIDEARQTAVWFADVVEELLKEAN